MFLFLFHQLRTQETRYKKACKTARYTLYKNASTLEWKLYWVGLPVVVVEFDAYKNRDYDGRGECRQILSCKENIRNDQQAQRHC